MDAIKHFVKKNQQLFHAFASHLDSIKKLLTVLDILAIATKKIQSDSFALTDFFGLWLDITMRLKISPHSECTTIMSRCLLSVACTAVVFFTILASIPLIGISSQIFSSTEGTQLQQNVHDIILLFRKSNYFLRP